MEKTTILLIDDDEPIRESLSAYLSDQKYNIAQAEGGQQGINLFSKDKHDIVITDLKMPEVDGLQVIKNISEQSPETPIIVISGTGIINDAIEAVRLGAWDYISKPIIDFIEITMILEKAIEKSILIKENIQYKENLEELLQKKSNELIKNEARYRTAETIAHIGNWEYNITTNTVWCSDEFYNIFEHTDEPTQDLLHFYKKYVLKKDLDNIQTCLSRAIERGADFQTEFGIKTKKNKIKYISSTGMTTNKDNKTIKIYGTIQDITEKKIAENQNKLLITDLETKNEEMERFTYSVSHDLRSPLITIKGFAELLEYDIEEGDQESIKENLGYINSALIKMSKLIDELLELSRIGRVKSERTEIRIDDVLTSAKEMLANNISSTNATITINDNIPNLYGDPLRINELFQNLIENAIKYSQKRVPPKIEIGCHTDTGKIIYYVKDNGIGIKPKYHTRVFNIFEQLTKRDDSSGIGLAIVKRIVDTHNGKIWIESNGENQGTTFLFYINTNKTKEQSPEISK